MKCRKESILLKRVFLTVERLSFRMATIQYFLGEFKKSLTVGINKISLLLKKKNTDIISSFRKLIN